MSVMQTSSPMRSQRKRKQISYYEGDIDSGLDSGYMSEEFEQTPAKKNKKIQAKRNSKPKKQSIFPFLSLPTELRYIIYKYALLNPAGIEIVTTTTKAHRRIAKRGEPNRPGIARIRRPFAHLPCPQGSEITPLSTLSPSILAVNRQINLETRHMLYTQPLVFQNTTALYTFLCEIGSQNRALLRDITINAWGLSQWNKALNHPAFSMLSDATGLKRLFVNAQIGGWNYDPKGIARTVWRNCHVWIAAVGVRERGRHAAIEILQVSDDNFKANRMGNVDVNRAIFEVALRKWCA